MNFSLDNNVNKLVLLLVVGVVLLLLIHMYKQKLGEQVSVLLSVVVLVVCGYFGYVLLNSPDENFNNPNESFSPIYEDFEAHNKHKEHFEGHNKHKEHFEAHEHKNKEHFEEHKHKEHFEDHEHKHKEHFEDHENTEESLNNGTLPGVPTPTPPTRNNTGNNDMDSSALFPASSDFCKVVPNNDGDVNCKSLLNAGHHIGVNTTGCSMRNANRGLRSEPPNPQVQVSPWLQTTICPDPFRKPLDGCD